MLSLELGTYGPTMSPAVISLASHPHVIVTGATGAGKTHAATVMLRSAASQGAEVVVADPKGAGDFVGVADQLAEGPGDAVDLVERVATGLHDRMGRDRTPLLVVVDELLAVQLRTVGESTKDARERSERIGAALGAVALMGRAARVSLLALSQRADTTAAIPGAVRDQITARICLGFHSPDGYRMLGFGDVSPPVLWPGHGWAIGLTGAPPGQPVPIHIAP